jgi:hypothetical protein
MSWIQTKEKSPRSMPLTLHERIHTQGQLLFRFALKFQKIVQDEQEANFISRLHAGQLNIVPWYVQCFSCLQYRFTTCYRPVIESQEFYKLFPTLKRRLDKQKLTHNTAGEFLHVMKTLMAKLKVYLVCHALCEVLIRISTGK